MSRAAPLPVLAGDEGALWFMTAHIRLLILADHLQREARALRRLLNAPV